MVEKQVNIPKPSTTGGDTANTSFENSLTFLLSTLGSRIALIAEQTLRRELDLSYMEWRVIQIVGTEPGAVPNRIIAVTGVNKANVSRAVSSLEQRGLLSRTPLETNARHIRLDLTRAGKVMYRKGNALRAKSQQPLFEGLSDAALDQLGETLRHIMRNVDEVREVNRGD